MEIPCLDHGFVRLVEPMGSDSAIVQAARVSYGEGTKTTRDDEALIRYLLRHHHTTPFEMCEIKFHAKMPIFVARQWVRHRTANINEYSARYSIMSDEFYVPPLDQMGPQSSSNKQGRHDPVSEFEDIYLHNQRKISQHSEASYDLYTELLAEEDNVFPGSSREISRVVLPVNFYTQWYWKIDLHNLFHFLKLRMDSHAQYEVRVYANAMAEITQSLFPVAYKAFEDYLLHAITFSRQEMDLIKRMLAEFDLVNIERPEISKREFDEFLQKIGALS